MSEFISYTIGTDNLGDKYHWTVSNFIDFLIAEHGFDADKPISAELHHGFWQFKQGV
jgi:hypothetical protein